MSGTALKLIALIFMTIDHIGVCIPETPLFFRWLGRIAAPIFFFCAAEGITHTSDRKLYLKRLWKMSMLMVFIEAVLPPFAEMVFGADINGFNNNIFLSIFQGTLIIHLLEESKNDKIKRIKYILGYVGYQLALIILYCIWSVFDPIGSLNLYIIPVVSDTERFIFTALGSVVYMEGSLILTGMIVLFYLCRENKKRLALWYGIYCAAYFLIFVPELPIKAMRFMGAVGVPSVVTEIFSVVGTLLGFNMTFSAGGFTQSLLQFNYQWMMILALPFMLAYNGEKGKGMKKLFYVYYPLHLVILHIAGAALC